MPKGEKNKLTDEQRQEIRDLKGRVSGRFVAIRYGVSHAAVYKIWKKMETKSQPKSQPNIDTKILKKLLKPMVKKNIKVDLNTEEITRVKELYNNG